MLIEALSGKQLHFNSKKKVEIAKEVKAHAREVNAHLSADVGLRIKRRDSSLIALAMQGFGISDIHRQVFLDTAREVIGNVMIEQLTFAVPYAGPVKAVFQAGKEGFDGYKRGSAAKKIERLASVEFKDPQYFLAAQAVCRYLSHEKALLLGAAAMHGVQGAARLALPPGSSALAAPQSLANLAFELAKVAFYTMQIVRSRTVLALTPVDAVAAFDTVPVLACWVLGFNDRRSDQMSFHKRDTSLPKEFVVAGFGGKVRRAVGQASASEQKHPLTDGFKLYTELIKEAHRIALKGPFAITGLGKDELVDADASSSAGSASSAGSSGSGTSSGGSSSYSGSGSSSGGSSSSRG